MKEYITIFSLFLAFCVTCCNVWAEESPIVEDEDLEDLVDDSCLDLVYQDQWPNGNVRDDYVCYASQGICQFNFQNGLHLNVKSRPGAERSLVALKFGNGYLVDKNVTPGFSWLAETLFLQGGVEQHSSNEVKHYLDRFDVSLKLETQADHFLLIGEAPRVQLKPLLTVMAAYMSEPGFNISEIDTASIRASKLKEINNSQSLLDHVFKQLINGHDVRVMFPDNESFKGWTTSAFKQKMLEQISSQNLELSIVGDYGMNNKEVAKMLFEPIMSSLGGITLSSHNLLLKDKPIRRPEKSVLAESFIYQGKVGDSVIACVYWDTIGSADREIFRSMRVMARFYADTLQERLNQKFNDRYLARYYCDGVDNFDFGILAIYAEVDPVDIDTVLDVMLTVAHDIEASVRIRKECFRAGLESVMNEFGQAFIQKIQEEKTVINPLDDSMHALLMILVDQARNMVNASNLSTDELIRALRANFYAVGHCMNILYSSADEIQLRAALQQFVYQFTQEFVAVVSKNESLGQDRLMMLLKQLDKASKSLFKNKSEYMLGITQLYIDANREAFLMKKALRDFFKNEIASSIPADTLLIIVNYVNAIQSRFNNVNLNDVLHSENLEHAIAFSLSVSDKLCDLLKEYPAELSYIDHAIAKPRKALKNILDNLNAQRLILMELQEKVKDPAELLVMFFKQLECSDVIDNLSPALFEVFAKWVEAGKALAHYELATKTLESLKQNTVWNAWKLLNPYSPSDGRRDPRDNTLKKAIEEELDEIIAVSHTSEYWLHDVLIDSSNHPERLVWSESIIDDYQHVALRDITLLIRFVLQPEKAHQIKILPAF